jgi:hypothetical protein
VGAVLRRLGLGRLKALDPPPPIVRYERERPGELLHLDTKKLGRIGGVGHRIAGRHTGAINRHHGIGWEVLHVFLGRALDWFARHGVAVERIMTDNGSAYRSHDFRAACAQAKLKHIRIRPYTPRTNGKAERFIQTSLREWAYARACRSSAERGDAMHPWIADYNNQDPPTLSPRRATARLKAEQRSWLQQLVHGSYKHLPKRSGCLGAADKDCPTQIVSLEFEIIPETPQMHSDLHQVDADIGDCAARRDDVPAGDEAGRTPTASIRDMTDAICAIANGSCRRRL